MIKTELAFLCFFVLVKSYREKNKKFKIDLITSFTILLSPIRHFLDGMASIIFVNFFITIDTPTRFFFYFLNRIMLSRLRIISDAPNKFGLRLVHLIRASKNYSNPHSCQPLSNLTSSALIPGNLSLVILT